MLIPVSQSIGGCGLAGKYFIDLSNSDSVNGSGYPTIDIP